MRDGLARSETARDSDLQRADGAARITAVMRGGKTQLAALYQRAPCKALFPYVDGRGFSQAVFLNTAGGVAGGDRLIYEMKLGAGAALTVATQTAERVYRALDAPGAIQTRIRVGEGAALEWLPQETILFDGGRLHRLTDINLAPSARLLALEWLVLGRTASGETVLSGEIIDRWRIARAGRLIWADAFRLTGQIENVMRRSCLLAGRRAIATLIYAGGDAPAQLERARAHFARLDCDAGATLVAGLLICRFAASAAVQLKLAVTQFLKAFRQGLEGFASPPLRIWA